MIGTHGPVRVWIASVPIDMRRGFDRLAEHVRQVLAGDPMSGHLFVFRNRSGERIKILWWDRNGYTLYYKRLERGTFQFPPAGDARSVTIGSHQLMQLLNGEAIKL